MEAIIDGSLDARYKPKSVRMIVDLVIRCVRPQGTQRPSSSDVVRDIEEAVHVELPLEDPQQMPMGAVDSDYSQELNMTQMFHCMASVKII